MNAANLASPDLFINRELSLLEFNRRVLEQAKSDDVPLLERLRFLCISGSNLDEFYEIRVAGLKQQEALGATQRGPDNLSPAEQLHRISDQAHDLVDEQYRVLNDVLFPLLHAEGIRFLRRSQWNANQEEWLADYFHRELEPILTPIGLDPAHPFPRIINKNLTFIVTVEGKDAFGRNSGTAVVQAPRALPRGRALGPGSRRASVRPRIPVLDHPRPCRRVVPRHAGGGLLSVPGHPQQRPVRR